MTIGDILAIVAGLVGICITAWALMVTCGLLFPTKAETARAALIAKPKATSCWFRASGSLALPGFVGVALLSAPNARVEDACPGW